MNMQETVAEWLNNVKAFFITFDLSKWTQDIGGASAPALLGAIYFGCSILIGYIMKRHFRIIFGSLVVAAIVIKSMEHFQLLTINWTHVQTTSGIDTSMSLNALFNLVVDKIKESPIIFVSSIVGFLIGHKLG